MSLTSPLMTPIKLQMQHLLVTQTWEVSALSCDAGLMILMCEDDSENHAQQEIIARWMEQETSEQALRGEPHGRVLSAQGCSVVCALLPVIG